MKALIAHDGIEVRFKNGLRLSFPSFTLERGAHCLVLGDSGSGKTTLLHVLSGLLKPASGTVKLAGVDIYALSMKEIDRFRGEQVGLIFQQAHLIKSLTLLENLKMARWLLGREENAKDLMVLLERLNLTDQARNYPLELSQGQLQRAAIARALVNRPRLLVADEPTSALDDRNAEAVIALLSEQAALYGASLLIATHDKRIKDKFSNTYVL
ncbi:ATP-binding cassette domain-containing protein [Olivibacter sp. CPCC 100613]|uniref:ABC transporter ATP-binding protein n=1 Tax=Olivibacter sp. CPCC 100613 TaxID=3079931 RepID=UPI002FFA212C